MRQCERHRGPERSAVGPPRHRSTGTPAALRPLGGVLRGGQRAALDPTAQSSSLTIPAASGVQPVAAKNHGTLAQGKRVPGRGTGASTLSKAKESCPCRALPAQWHNAFCVACGNRLKVLKGFKGAVFMAPEKWEMGDYEEGASPENLELA